MIFDGGRENWEQPPRLGRLVDLGGAIFAGIVIALALAAMLLPDDVILDFLGRL